MGGKTPAEAISQLSQIPPYEKIILTNGTQTFEIPTKEINLVYDFGQTAARAFEIPRSGNIFYDFAKRITLPFKKEEIGLSLTIDEEKLADAVSVIAGQVGVEPVYPSVKLIKGEVLVDKGKGGLELDQKNLRILIGQNLSFVKNQTITLPIKEINPSLSEEEATRFSQRAEKLKNKSLTLNFEFQTFVYKGGDLFEFLDPKNEYQKDKVLSAAEKIVPQIERPPQDSVFVFEGGRVQEFAPSKDGVVLKRDVLIDMILGNLRTLENQEESNISFDIPVEKTPPKIKNEDVNNLGIKELIGRGTSRFRGSIPNRVYNISLAASKFKGVLVDPGAVFSFNDTLGDVSVFTGYKQAYVIKDGKTVLGDGGGVCQVSTTLFRAALNAGLPITERRAHAYRVGYYEQDSPPGLDATVYSPTTDLKIKNDTPGHILIQSFVDTKTSTLTFEIYGTSDGRMATVSKPSVTNVTPPPEDLYQDDPTLPSGTIKQTEHKAWGAKVTFNYKVEKDGVTTYQKLFVSNYRPWQAVYLRGTGPVQ